MKIYDERHAFFGFELGSSGNYQQVVDDLKYFQKRNSELELNVNEGISKKILSDALGSVSLTKNISELGELDVLYNSTSSYLYCATVLEEALETKEIQLIAPELRPYLLTSPVVKRYIGQERLYGFNDSVPRSIATIEPAEDITYQAVNNGARLQHEVGEYSARKYRSSILPKKIENNDRLDLLEAQALQELMIENGLDPTDPLGGKF